MSHSGRSGGPSLDARLEAFRTSPHVERAGPLALDLLTAGRAREALEVVRAAAPLGGDTPGLLLLEGRSLLALGELVPAQAVFVKAARALPRDARPYVGLGEVLLARGDAMRALKALRKARTLDPSNRQIVALLERARTAAGAPPSVPPPARASTAPPPARAPGRTHAAPSEGISIHEAATVISDVGHLAAPGFEESPTEMAPNPLLEAAVPPVESPPADPPHRPFDPNGDEDPTDQWGVAGSLPGGVFSTRRAPTEPEPAVAPAPLPGLFESRSARPEPAVALAPRAAHAPSASRPAPSLDDPAALLAALRTRNLLMDSSEVRAWVRDALPRERTRLAKPLTFVWVLVLLLVGAGAGGWHLWTRHRWAQADELLQRARKAAVRGDHQGLVDAERWLRQARRLHPRRVEIPETLLLVMSQRTLEEGRFESNLIRPVLAKAKKDGADSRLLRAAEALLLLTEGEREEAAETWQQLPDSPEPHLAYLLGRIGQRLHTEGAEEKLRGAAEADPKFAAPRFGLLEHALASEDSERAEAWLSEVLSAHPGHLRARLWKARMEADEVPPAEGFAALGAFDEEVMKKAAPVDHVLLALARARLARRNQDLSAAKAFLEEATKAGISDPRLLAMLAEEALATRAMGLAEALASRAASSDPSEDAYRLLLAEILLARRAGVRALRVLAPLSNRNPRVLRASAEAALLVGSREALDAAAGALQEHLRAATEHESDPRLLALSLRLRARLGDPAPLLSKVRALARSTPGDADVARALGDVALRAHQPQVAVEALEKLVEAAPEDAEAWYLLGRARRSLGRIREAEEAFRRAVELAPSYADALVSLGYLLLDRGSYEEAEQLYASLTRRAGPSSGASLALLGRVGRAEALVGLGRLEDARIQLQAIKGRDAERPFVRVVRARLSLSAGKPSEALAALRSLLSKGEPSPRVLALAAQALLAARETEAARETVERLLARDATHPDGLALQAELLLRSGDFGRVLEVVETALRALEHRARAPELKARLLLLAARALLEGRPPNPGRAARLLREAKDLPGAPNEVWFFLGEALASQDAAAARKAYTRYLDLAPRGPLARRARKALR